MMEASAKLELTIISATTADDNQFFWQKSSLFFCIFGSKTAILKIF